MIRHEIRERTDAPRILIIGGERSGGNRTMVDTSQGVPPSPVISGIRNGMGIFAKRVEDILRSAPPKLRIMSVNPDCGTDERDAGAVNVIGRAVRSALRY